MNFWTSDEHWGHKNIPRLASRPFGKFDITDMDEIMIARWNEVVAPDDNVMIVGDAFMGTFDITLKYALRLLGHKFLVPGNHDRCFSGWGNHKPKYGPQTKELYEEVGITVLAEQLVLFDFSEPVQVCHFPYSGDSHGEDRYADKRPLDNGRWLLHGHTHSQERVRGRQIHVGVDAWNFYPVSQTQIQEIIDGGVQA